MFSPAGICGYVRAIKREVCGGDVTLHKEGTVTEPATSALVIVSFKSTRLNAKLNYID